MRTTPCFASCLLVLSGLNAQDSGAPRQDPFADGAPATDPEAPPPLPRNLTLRFEDFSLDLATAAELLRTGPADEELYQKLLAMVGKNEARQESMTVIRARSGQRANADSVAEKIFATEHEPPELPNTVGVSISPPKPDGDANAPATVPDTEKLEHTLSAAALGDLRTPAMPAAFETRNSGRVIAVEPVMGEDSTFIDLTCSSELVLLAGTSKHGQGLSLIEMPEYEVQRNATSTTVRNGKPFLLGTMNRPPNSAIDPDAAGRIWLAFVTTTVTSP